MHHLLRTRQWRPGISDSLHRTSSPKTTAKRVCYRNNALSSRRFHKRAGICCFVPHGKTSAKRRSTFDWSTENFRQNSKRGVRVNDPNSKKKILKGGLESMTPTQKKKRVHNWEWLLQGRFGNAKYWSVRKVFKNSSKLRKFGKLKYFQGYRCISRVCSSYLEFHPEYTNWQTLITNFSLKFGVCTPTRPGILRLWTPFFPSKRTHFYEILTNDGLHQRLLMVQFS